MFQIAQQTTEEYADGITLADAKAWLKVDHDDDDALIGVLRDAAVNHCEVHTNRYFRTSTFSITAPNFRHLRRLPVGVLNNVTSITYFKENDATEYTLASSEYTTSLLGDVLHVNFRNTVPDVDPYRSDAVKLISGGGVRADLIPEAVRTAALLLVGHWYENRSAVQIGTSVIEMPIAVNALLAQYRLQ